MASRPRPGAAGAASNAPLLPMEARLVSELPRGAGWQFEPKWDGFRCLAPRDDDDVQLFAKSGKPLLRYFPDVAALLRELPARRLILDGELAIPAGDSLSFDALQLRLHPAASRVAKLAAADPAIFIAFDLLLAPRAEQLAAAPLSERRAALECFLHKREEGGRVRLSPCTRDREEAERWLQRAGGALDGVIAKRLDEPYRPGERAMLKVKRTRTADCVVGAFRYGSGSRVVGSLLLGLYDDTGRLDHVGFTSGFADIDRTELTRRLEALRGGPGFTGKAPGGPSRWSTERSGEIESLHHEMVVEVSYDHVTGNRFRHGTRLLRWRPDKAPLQCTMAQLEREAPPERLLKEVIGR